MGTYKEMEKRSKCGAAFNHFLNETCRTIQKNLKTATAFLICYSNLSQQNILSSKQYFFAEILEQSLSDPLTKMKGEAKSKTNWQPKSENKSIVGWSFNYPNTTTTDSCKR